MTEKMVCVESLARWGDPDKGIISPDVFVPALENSGLIFKLDMEILRQACALYNESKQQGTTLHSISVNLSRRDFRNPDLYDSVVEILANYNVPHDVINLEITESLMLEDEKSFRVVLDRFNDSGFSIWIDDFGSGYSSLNVLKNFNFNLMKFDMLFLKDFSIKGRRLLASMINMAKSLGIRTLAEGVESKEQQEFLRAAGCEILQGFYYSKPLTKEDLMELICSGEVQLENRDEKTYWRKIGQLNLLSAYPIKDYTQLEMSGSREDFDLDGVGASIALVECSKSKSRCIYASESYKKNIRKLGYASIVERVASSPSGFIQGFFRMRWRGDDKIWHIVRFTRVPTTSENAYLLTMQTIHGQSKGILDLINREHPELLD